MRGSVTSTITTIHPMNITEIRRDDPDSNAEVAAYYRERSGGPGGFTDLFDWLIARQNPDLDKLQAFLLVCHGYVAELIDEINGDEFPDRKTRLCKQAAAQIGFDKLMDLFLHDAGPDWREDELYAAEWYVGELIERVRKSEKANQ